MQIAVLGNRAQLIYKVAERLPIDNIRILQNPSQLSENDDVAFFLSYYKLVKPKYFQRPKHGSFVAHASDLPKGRGWAPVSWALINNDKQITLTTFKIDDGCDTGPYHIKSNININITDTNESAYIKVENEIVKHLKSVIKEILEKGSVSTTPQSGDATWNERRYPKDSELNANKSLLELWSLIRSCKNDEYPAYFKLDGKKIYIRHEVENDSKE